MYPIIIIEAGSHGAWHIQVNTPVSLKNTSKVVMLGACPLGADATGTFNPVWLIENVCARFVEGTLEIVEKCPKSSADAEATSPTVPVTERSEDGTGFDPLSKLVIVTRTGVWSGTVKFAGKYSSKPETGLNDIVR
jgi:hypothetical protein